jgi:Tfp pilus assembly PilM family ATPase
MRLSRIRETALNLVLQPRNLAKSLDRWIPGAAQTMAVIALDGHWLKLLQMDGSPAGKRISKALVFPVGGAGLEELQKAFKQAWGADGLTARDVLVANPTHLCTTRLFSLPSTDPKEIRDIVELQAEKHTPYAKEEILTDFQIVSRERSGYSSVLLVIAHQDVVFRPVRLVETAGLNLEHVGCELEGLINWFQLFRRSAGSKAETSLVVDVDRGTTTVLLIHRGALQLHRSLAMGSEQLEADLAKAGEQLLGELRRSIESIDTEGSALKLQEAVVTGRVDRLGELKAVLERGLEVPVVLVSPWALPEIPEAVQAAAADLPEVSFAGLIGLALTPGTIDLTPHTTKLHQAFETRAKAIVLLGSQLVGMLILFTLLIVGRAQKEQRYYTALRGLYEQTEARALHVEQALIELGLVRERLRLRGHLLEAVDTLTQLSPSEIRWTSLTFNPVEGTVLKGTSDALPTIYEFVDSLSNAPVFGRVEARRVIKRSVEGKEVSDFEIACQPPTIAGAP